MATITSLATLAKTSVTADDYLLTANGVALANNKFLLQDLFPTVNTLGTTSESLFVSISNKNVLNFKGIKSLNSLLTVATASNNITLQVNEANINLANCNNVTAGFLTSVNLATNVTGILPVANGGTGLSNIPVNSLVLGNGTAALASLGVATNGQIPIGRTGLSPVLANLTAGSNITITNGSGSITISALLSSFTNNVNANNYSFYGFSWLSGDGTNKGIKIDSTGQVYTSSTLGTTPFYYGDLNIDNSIYLNGSKNQIIRSFLYSGSAAGTFTIQAASSASSAKGGALYLKAGASNGAFAGGEMEFYVGSHDGLGAGSAGDFVFWGYNASAVAQKIMTMKGASKYVGINTATPATFLDVKQDGTTANIPVVRLEQLDTDESFINFVGTSGAASANSISSSTASAGSKTGAIRIKINGVDAWIRVYATAE